MEQLPCRVGVYATAKDGVRCILHRIHVPQQGLKGLHQLLKSAGGLSLGLRMWLGNAFDQQKHLLTNVVFETSRLAEIEDALRQCFLRKVGLDQEDHECLSSPLATSLVYAPYELDARRGLCEHYAWWPCGASMDTSAPNSHELAKHTDVDEEHAMKILSLLTAAALLSGVAIANAADPIALTDTQLDEIAAGQASVSITAAASASGFNSATITIDGTADTTAEPGAYTASGSLTVTSASD